jgi:hypothetical protein
MTPTKSSKLKQKSTSSQSSTLQDTGPGPGNYSLSGLSKGISHSFSRGLRVKDRKSQRIGPGLYKLPENFSNIGGVMTPKRSFQNSLAESPGPAAYSPLTSKPTRCFSIGKSSRYLKKKNPGPGPGSYELPQVRSSSSAV